MQSAVYLEESKECTTAAVASATTANRSGCRVYPRSALPPVTTINSSADVARGAVSPAELARVN